MAGNSFPLFFGYKPRFSFEKLQILNLKIKNIHNSEIIQKFLSSCPDFETAFLIFNEWVPGTLKFLEKININKKNTNEIETIIILGDKVVHAQEFLIRAIKYIASPTKGYRSGSLKISPSTDRPSIDYYKRGNKTGILGIYGLHANSEQGAISTQDRMDTLRS